MTNSAFSLPAKILYRTGTLQLALERVSTVPYCIAKYLNYKDSLAPKGNRCKSNFILNYNYTELYFFKD